MTGIVGKHGSFSTQNVGVGVLGTVSSTPVVTLLLSPAIPCVAPVRFSSCQVGQEDLLKQKNMIIEPQTSVGKFIFKYQLDLCVVPLRSLTEKEWWSLLALYIFPIHLPGRTERVQCDHGRPLALAPETHPLCLRSLSSLSAIPGLLL